MPQPLSSRSRLLRLSLIGANTERCIYCGSTRITREGKRYKKLETVQLWYCHDCDRVFTPQVVQGKHTPLKVIMGLQAFPAENLLCALEPLILLSFYHRVIKKGVGNPLCFGVENRGFFLVPKVIIYESLYDHWDE